MYANSSLDFVAQSSPWTWYTNLIGRNRHLQLTNLTSNKETAQLISVSWSCSENAYSTQVAAEATDGWPNVRLITDWSIPSSTFGSTKATTFTTYTVDPSPDTGDAESVQYLIIAVRGTAAKIDHIVNLNGEPRHTGELFVSSLLHLF